MSGSLDTAASTEPTLLHTFLRRAEEEPQTVFASFDRRPGLPLGEMAGAIRRFANALGERAVGPGSRVLLALDSSPEFVVAWLGSWHAGATIVPMIPASGERLYARALGAAQPSLAVVGPRAAARLRTNAAADGLELVVVDSDSSEPLAPALDAFLAAAEAGENLAAGEETASVIFTSGTTGPPKGVCLSHLWFVWASGDVARGMEYGAADVLYTCLPLGHANAQDTTFGAALVSGARAVFDRRFSASRFWSRLRDVGATAFNLIGAMPRILLNRDAGEYAGDHGANRAFAIPALPGYRDEFRRRFAVEMLQGYGSTEVGMPVFEDRRAVRPGSCGLPVPGTELRIARADGSTAEVDKVGEICIRSSRPGALTSGYLGEPERTAEAFRDGWFHSGDLGRLDPEGHLFFAGRMGDVLRRKGESLSAYEVESALMELDSVQECAAVGRHLSDGEDEILVYLVAADGRAVDRGEIAAHCVSALGRAAEPAEVWIVKELPKTESGKVAKGGLHK
jgi:crotonobetaine/carnitine-CoA ligase